MATELVALAWQPVGGGNSIAVCGLAVAGAGQERDRPVGRPTAVAVVATGSVLALATDIHGAALLAGTALALVTTDRDGRPRRAPVRRHL